MNGSGDDTDTLAPRHRKAVSLSVSIYNKLLVAYPRELRQEYAGEMERYFGELCKDSVGRGGLAALLLTWLRTLYELAVSARLERKRSLPQGEVIPDHAVAAALLLFPGCGQAYNGQWLKALMHASIVPGAPLILGLWLGVGGPIAGVLFGGLYLYSTLEAWITARRIKALQRVRY